MYMINIVLYTILWYTIGFRIVQISSTKFIMTYKKRKKEKNQLKYQPYLWSHWWLDDVHSLFLMIVYFNWFFSFFLFLYVIINLVEEIWTILKPISDMKKVISWSFYHILGTRKHFQNLTNYNVMQITEKDVIYSRTVGYICLYQPALVIRGRCLMHFIRFLLLYHICDNLYVLY
jgi:hypothetical protein